MKKTILGTQGLEVPSVGLGCMGMSEFYGASDERECLTLLDKALEIGCSFWDTSDMYGPFTNEELLGNAMAGRRTDVTLATKFGIKRDSEGDWLGVDGSPEYVKASCDASLKRLGTDYIDLYYQHRIDPNIPIEETVGAMAELVAAGKVRYLGLSEASAETIERANKVHPISAVQSEYSLWSRDVETDVLPTIRRLGIGFVAYSPLGRGFLSGQVANRNDLEAGDWRLENPRFQEDAMAHNKALVEKIAELAQSLDISTAQLALAWVLAQSSEIASIPGTRREAYLLQNWQAQDIEFSPNQLALLNETSSSFEVTGSRY